MHILVWLWAQAASLWESRAAIAQVAPAVTAAVATCALLVAIWSIASQKRLARKRAAIDFILKIATDQELVSLRRNLSSSVQRVIHARSPASDEVHEAFHRITTALNLFEAMAAGIHTKALDDTICYLVLSDEFLEVFDGTAAIRERISTFPSAARSASEMGRLSRKWNNRVAREGKAKLW